MEKVMTVYSKNPNKKPVLIPFSDAYSDKDIEFMSWLSSLPLFIYEDDPKLHSILCNYAELIKFHTGLKYNTSGHYVLPEIFKRRDVIKFIKPHCYICGRLAELQGSRWYPGESTIMKSTLAVSYAKNYIKGRWPRAERYIMKQPISAVNYAMHILKGRWIRAEKYIVQDMIAFLEYLKYLNGHMVIKPSLNMSIVASKKNGKFIIKMKKP